MLQYIAAPHPQPCQWQDMIDSYLDAEMPDGQASLFEAHLPNCKMCKEELALANQMVLAFQEFEDAPCPDPVVASIMQRVDAEIAASQSAKRLVWWQQLKQAFTLPQLSTQTWRPALAMAVVALVALTVFWMTRPNANQAPQWANKTTPTQPKTLPQPETQALLPSESLAEAVKPRQETTSTTPLTPTVTKSARSQDKKRPSATKPAPKLTKKQALEEEQYSEAEINKAFEDAKLAFALIGQASEKATQIQDDILQNHVNEPIQDALRKPFEGLPLRN